MRIYTSVPEAVREVERDLWEMGIDVHPQTMQDKAVADDDGYATKELQAYGFKIVDYSWSEQMEREVIDYVFRATTPDYQEAVHAYVRQEFNDRVSSESSNPGRSYLHRDELWREYMDHRGKFHYTYSERIVPQLAGVIKELRTRRESRQGIINIHSNIASIRSEEAQLCADWAHKGGVGRVPCSLHYQAMIRRNALDFIYSMRSCDFLTHFPVDILLALRMQQFIAHHTQVNTGNFTYFTGSLHAYKKDMVQRGIF